MFIINKDHLDDETVSVIGPRGVSDADADLLKRIAAGNAPKGSKHNHFRIYDDDGTLYLSGYYVARNGSDEFEPLDCYGASWGATEIRMRFADGKYHTV